MKKHFTLFLFLIYAVAAYSQSKVSGTIKDAKTNKAVPFVTILYNNSNTGISADIDGRFTVKEGTFSSLTFSAIGYEKLHLTEAQITSQNFNIKLSPSTYNLSEVVIVPGENPAHRIIHLAVENRNRNNPEKNTAFFYESYNKMVFTTPLDSSIKSSLDSITIQSAIAEKVDSFEMSKILFLMESIAERNYIPPHHSKELVTESRISGLKTPFFSLLGTQLQSFSLYEDYVEIYGLNYLSPISKGSTSKYLFILEDTLFSGADTSFIISFRPRRNKYFAGLKGVLSINSNQYAVEHFAATQSDSNAFPVSVQQRYQLIENKQWFPVQLHIDILFEADADLSMNIKGVGKSYIRKIQLKSALQKNEIGNVNLKMADDIKFKNEAYWKTVREVPLSRNELASYQYIDSIGEAENFDKIVYLTKGFAQGFVPIGKFNLMLNKLAKFNEFEGTRLGLGFETGDGIIKNLHLGAFAGYGFKDKAWKYGSHLRWQPNSEKQFEMKLSYANDLINIGGVEYFKKTRDLTSTSNIQNLVNDQLDGIELYQTEISFRALRDFHFTFFGNQQTRTLNSKYNYDAKENQELTNYSYRLTEAGINFRFSFQEKFTEFLGLTLPIVTKYPVIYFKYSHGFKGLLLGEYDYNRYDLSIFKSATIKHLGVTSFQINAGLIDKSIPLTAQYTMRGIYNEEVKIASSYSFETMLPNEFFAEQYVNLFWRHNFGKLLFQSAKFKPEFLIVSSVAYGKLDAVEKHQNFDFKTFEKGYFESGIQVNNLLRIKYFFKGIYFGFGVGAYYRYGEYQLPNMEDNFAFKLTTTLSL